MVDAAIETLVGELAAAWNRGDAVAFAKRDDGDWSIAAFHNTAVQTAPIVR